METLTQLDEQIAQVEGSLATLRQELMTMDRTKPGFLRVQAMIAFGESSLAGLKAQRAKLEAQR